MIEFTKAYKASTGETYATLEEAQRKELSGLLGIPFGAADSPLEKILSNKEKVVDILSTTPTSKPRARSINGGRKKRKTAPDSAVNRELQDGKQ